MLRVSSVIHTALLVAFSFAPAVFAELVSDYAHLNVGKLTSELDGIVTDIDRKQEVELDSGDLDSGEISESKTISHDPSKGENQQEFQKAVESQMQFDDIPTVEDTPAREVKVRMLVTTHAADCKNATQSFTSGVSYVTSNAIIDPGLSDCGWHQAGKAGQALKEKGIEPDLVVAGSMLKAMETALAMYPGKTVVPMPYLAGDLLVTQMTNKVDLMQTPFFKKERTEHASVDFKWVLRSELTTARDQNAFGHFLNFMAHNGLPSLPAELQKKDSITVAVVTHWETVQVAMQKLCGREQEMKYAEVVELSWVFKAYVAAATQTGIVVKTDQVDPYISDATEAWEAMKGIPDDALLQTSLLPLIGKPQLMFPGSTSSNSFFMDVNRVLEPSKQQSCTVQFEGFAHAPGKFLCQRDFGKTCEKILVDRFHAMLRPSVTMMAGEQGECCVDQ